MPRIRRSAKPKLHSNTLTPSSTRQLRPARVLPMFVLGYAKRQGSVRRNPLLNQRVLARPDWLSPCLLRGLGLWPPPPDQASAELRRLPREPWDGGPSLTPR